MKPEVSERNSGSSMKECLNEYRFSQVLLYVFIIMYWIEWEGDTGSPQ